MNNTYLYALKENLCDGACITGIDPLSRTWLGVYCIQIHESNAASIDYIQELGLILKKPAQQGKKNWKSSQEKVISFIYLSMKLWLL